jgi:hypothetical protein
MNVGDLTKTPVLKIRRLTWPAIKVGGLEKTTPETARLTCPEINDGGKVAAAGAKIRRLTCPVTKLGGLENRTPSSVLSRDRRVGVSG